MTERFAIYFAPSANSSLWDRAATWLGRDSATGETFDGPVAGMDRNRLLNLTQSANRYGFHATIKPPMALVEGAAVYELRATLRDFARTKEPFSLGQLQIASLGGFLALVVPGVHDQLQDFAADVVETFEPLRAELSVKDKAARREKGLTPRQDELLEAYGYPYLFDEFRFHMTLTDRLDPSEHDEVQTAAQAWFGPELGNDVVFDRLALFHEAERGLPFSRLEDYKLGA